MKKFTLLFLSALLAGYAQAQWTTVCGAGDGMVVSLASYKGSVYAAGFFSNICGTSAKHIARWDGTSWYAVDTGLSDAGHNVRVVDTDLYVAQYMQSIDSNWILKWDGTHFQKIGEGVYLTTAVTGASKVPNLYDIVKYRGNIIACGEFDRVGDRHISGIMQWDGTKWDSLGSGLGGSIDGSGIMYPHQLMVMDTSLYVIGNFATAGGITVNGVARWDGTQWHAMGSGFNTEAYGINVVNSEIYVGGDFTHSGTAVLQRIAKWNGTDWVNPGFGVYYSIAGERPYVHTIQQIDSHGIFEGGFDRVITGTDTFVANNIIAYNGVGIDTLDGGIKNANFEGIVQYGSDILVGGAIFAAGTSDTTRVSTYHFSTLAAPVTTISSGYNIYPNPFSGQIRIDNLKKGDKLILSNIVGQQIKQMTAAGNNETMNLDNLQQGAYILQINSAGKIQYKELFRQ